MRMKLVFYGLVVVLLASLAGCGYLFWIQNASHTVLTSFEFWGVGRLGRAWKVTELIAVSGLVGFALAFIPLGLLWWRSSGEVRRLKRQLAVGSGESSSFR